MYIAFLFVCLPGVGSLVQFSVHAEITEEDIYTAC